MIPIKLLWIGGGTVATAAAAATVAVTGYNPFESRAMQEPAAIMQPQVQENKENSAAITSENAKAKPDSKPDGKTVVAALPDTKSEAAETAAATETQMAPPEFSVVRVEPDGSLVIAGSAAPNSRVELMAGTVFLGETKAGPGGDFAIILDEPLKPGDYQLVLRATNPDGQAATSPETAIVAVPERADGQVLALVEQPGEPSRLITKPAAKPGDDKAVNAAANDKLSSTDQKNALAEEKPESQAANQPDAQTSAQTGADNNGGTQEEEIAAVSSEPDVIRKQEPEEPVAASKPLSAPKSEILVEAVEIEGRHVFVAGAASGAERVRVYANEILLGETEVTDAGRFLVETVRDLAVGDYIIRADLLSKNGLEVIARAAVPFQREAGEAVAAIAPVPAPQKGPDKEAPKVQIQAEEASRATEVEKVAATNVPASEPVETTAPALQPTQASVIIRRGDSLWRISRRVYGRGVRYSTIYLANQEQIADPHRIWPGQVFRVPEKTMEGEAADLSTIEAPPMAEAGSRKAQETN